MSNKQQQTTPSRSDGRLEEGRFSFGNVLDHITDGTPCWCEPEVNYVDPETGASVVVHKEPQ